MGYTQQDFVKIGHPLADPEFFLYGDSKAGQLLYGLDATLMDLNRSAVYYVENGCLFLPNSGKLQGGHRVEGCVDSTRKALQFAKEGSIPVLVARSWYISDSAKARHYEYMSHGENRPIDMNDISEMHISALKSIAKESPTVEIHILADNRLFNGTDEATQSIAQCVSRPMFFNQPCTKKISINSMDVPQEQVEIDLENFAEKTRNIFYYNAEDMYCFEGVCPQISENGKILYSDAAHLSKEGSKLVAKSIIEALDLNHPLVSQGAIQLKPDLINEIDEAVAASDLNRIDAAIENFLKFSYSKKDLYDLVNMYWNGSEKTEQNRQTGRIVAEKFSQKQDETLSTYISGFAYWWGTAGVEKDFDKALEYWEKPSQLSNATVQYRMAEIYLDESLPQHDPVKGLEKLRLAVEAGNEDAIARLATLND